MTLKAKNANKISKNKTLTKVKLLKERVLSIQYSIHKSKRPNTPAVNIEQAQLLQLLSYKQNLHQERTKTVLNFCCLSHTTESLRDPKMCHLLDKNLPKLLRKSI